jgi:hypothetical protein
MGQKQQLTDRTKHEIAALLKFFGVQVYYQ